MNAIHAKALTRKLVKVLARLIATELYMLDKGTGSATNSILTMSHSRSNYRLHGVRWVSSPQKPIIHFELIHYRNVQGGRELRQVRNLIRLWLDIVLSVRPVWNMPVWALPAVMYLYEQGRGDREVDLLSAQRDNGTEVLV